MKYAISYLVCITQILSRGGKGSKNGRSKDLKTKGSKSKGSKGGGYYKYGGYWSVGSSEDEVTDHGDGSVGHGDDMTQVRASLADITQLRAEIDKLIIDSERELIPKFLRLGDFGLALCAFQHHEHET